MIGCGQGREQVTRKDGKKRFKVKGGAATDASNNFSKEGLTTQKLKVTGQNWVDLHSFISIH
jgi:hypothetical protein